MNPTDGGADAAEILIGEDERGTVIRAVGHIRANESYVLREEILPGLDGPSPKDYFVDLSGCSFMDSTFIGLLVAADKKLSRSCGRRMRIFNPAPGCAAALKRLGLEKILHMETGVLKLPARMRALKKSGKPGAEFILKTHEALMETSAEAKKQFGLVMELLAKKLRGK